MAFAYEWLAAWLFEDNRAHEKWKKRGLIQSVCLVAMPQRAENLKSS